MRQYEWVHDPRLRPSSSFFFLLHSEHHRAKWPTCDVADGGGWPIQETNYGEMTHTHTPLPLLSHKHTTAIVTEISQTYHKIKGRLFFPVIHWLILTAVSWWGFLCSQLLRKVKVWLGKKMHTQTQTHTEWIQAVKATFCADDHPWITPSWKRGSGRL